MKQNEIALVIYKNWLILMKMDQKPKQIKIYLNFGNLQSKVMYFSV
jgi:hypothetical protein